MDSTTEHGGVLLHLGHRFLAQGFEPMYRRHDLKYVPSNEMIGQLYFGVAHYHFHAQRYKNTRFAGPGEGDLKLARSLNANYLVFTFIDRNRLNVDYYQRGRIVVDLGTVKRNF